MNEFVKSLPEDFQEDIFKAIDLLKKEGCTEIFIFGSLANGFFYENSDIDFAVRGLESGKYFEIGGKLMFLLKHDFHLIKLDDPQSQFAQFIEKNEGMIRVA